MHTQVLNCMHTHAHADTYAHVNDIHLDVSSVHLFDVLTRTVLLM